MLQFEKKIWSFEQKDASSSKLGKLLFIPDEQKILLSELILFRMNKKVYHSN